jgi:zinc transport system ATP-binding protein
MTALGDSPIPAISIRDLWFAYDGPPVLREVSFDIAPGDFVSIIGPNGGGKTTLLKLLLGLLSPTRGSVRVFGQPPDVTRKRLGYMPQQISLDASFPVTALDVVLMGRLGHGFPVGPFRRADREAAETSLRDVEAHDLGNRGFFSLSGGQRQRVLIARALASGPELLLLDEPTASLDPAVQDDLYELLTRLNQRMTIVLVSHDIGVVSKHVRTVVCVSGQVAIHPVEAISGELARVLFHGTEEVKLVRHDQCEGGHPGHTPGTRHETHPVVSRSSSPGGTDDGHGTTPAGADSSTGTDAAADCLERR